MTIDPTCMVFKPFASVFITTKPLPSGSVVFVIYNTIYSVLGDVSTTYSLACDLAKLTA
jgi:hypothetical protein